MKEAIVSRGFLPELEADFLTYMAGFTHYAEASTVLENHSLVVRGPIPSIYDAVTETLHLKILISEMSREIGSLDLRGISQQYNIPKVLNCINWSRNGIYPANPGGDIENTKLHERLQYLDSIDPGLEEEVVSLFIPKNDAKGENRSVHVAWSPRRNVLIDQKRIFSNASAVIAVATADPAHNLSVERLEKSVDVYDSYQSAIWYVIMTEEASKLISFLDRIGATHLAVPFAGNNSDYLTKVIEDLTSRID